MKYFVFRNQTIEPLMGDDGVQYSGYDDISVIPADAQAYIWFYQPPVNPTASQLAQEIATYGDKLQLVLGQIDASKPMIVFTLENLFPLRLTGDEMQVRMAIDNFNALATRLAGERSNVKVVDLSEFTSRYDAATLVNWKFYFISQALLNPKLARDFKAWWGRIEGELALKRKKCLVLDLDGTLWGGILGEDGIDGIAIGGDYPGKAFTYWQRALLELSRNGVILAVCSKNNEADVKQAWEQNPFMILKEEHFAAMRINWQDKASNLQELASELNIGLDSMVFVDDNPTERELIKQVLPMVAVPDFPSRPHELMTFYKQLVEQYFRIYAITDEDRSKTQQYRANAQRRAQQAQFTDMTAYLRSLGLQLTITPADAHNRARLAQMTQKTNQFNLTTHRYTEADVQQMMDKNWTMRALAVSDRFGDNGITGTIFVTPPDAQGTAQADTLLLSCRILGKGIEIAFVHQIFNDLRAQGVKTLEATYIPTAKNGQTADFWERAGMTLVSEDPDGTRHYTVALDHDFPVEEYYSVTRVES